MSAPKVERMRAEGLDVRDVVVHYGKEAAVRGVSFQVPPGHVVGLLGPSGSGKTTMLRAVAGYLQPTSGSIRLEDRDIIPIPPRRRDFGMVFQGYALFPHLKVADNVEFGLRARKVPKAESKARVAEVLAAMELSPFADRYPGQLSGGQQQRVALARALAIRPSLLLMDEPLAALDLKLREALADEIRRIQRELGVSMLFVTHDQQEAFAICDEVAIFHQGLIVAYGRPEVLYRRPPTRFTARFLGVGSLFDCDVEALKREAVVQGLPGQSDAGALTAPVDAQTAHAAVFVRPEAVQLSANSGDTPARGRVVRRRFLGRDALVTIETPEGSLVQAFDGADVAQEGDLVGFSWRVEDAHFIEEDEDGISLAADGQGLVARPRPAMLSGS